MTEGYFNRRQDIVLFVNGLPLVVMIKNAGNANTTVDKASIDFQTLPKLKFRGSSGQSVCLNFGRLRYRIGTITSPRERFAAWKTVDGETVCQLQSGSRAEGALAARLLELIHYCIVFEDDGKTVIKKGRRVSPITARCKRPLITALRASARVGDGEGGVYDRAQAPANS